jgi:hypothetical protein
LSFGQDFQFIGFTLTLDERVQSFVLPQLLEDFLTGRIDILSEYLQRPLTSVLLDNLRRLDRRGRFLGPRRWGHRFAGLTGQSPGQRHQDEDPPSRLGHSPAPAPTAIIESMAS